MPSRAFTPVLHLHQTPLPNRACKWGSSTGPFSLLVRPANSSEMGRTHRAAGRDKGEGSVPIEGPHGSQLEAQQGHTIVLEARGAGVLCIVVCFLKSADEGPGDKIVRRTIPRQGLV